MLSFYLIGINIVFKERIYKIWKQFTTLFQIHYFWFYCVQRTNIQNLKAIHNIGAIAEIGSKIVFKERIYKIWKQFTTVALRNPRDLALCSKNEYTKSESNSQLVQDDFSIFHYCVQRTNIQNLKAIHNCGCWYSIIRGIVFKERIYKIWKQFTTWSELMPDGTWLCSKNEYTKSESNSQQPYAWTDWLLHCVQRTNIQNLKAIHNSAQFKLVPEMIVFKERIYKIWKQFTTQSQLHW